MGLPTRPPIPVTVFTLKDEADLERVLRDHSTVVIDFWAEWCAPCQEFAPLFEAAAERHTDLAFCRANSGEAQPLARAFGVSSIPTLLVVRERILVVEQPGFISEPALEDILQSAKELDMDALRREMASAAGDAEDEKWAR